jgi:hypothetical protein
MVADTVAPIRLVASKARAMENRGWMRPLAKKIPRVPKVLSPKHERRQ